jgi:polysaccharide export outer membrane protein
VPVGVPEIPAEVAPESVSIPTDPSARAYLEVDGTPEYLIGAGDGLTLTLRAVESREEKVTVRPDGNVSFSLVENVRAAGLTPTQLDQALTRELSRFLRDPKVDVEVTEYRSKMVSLLGALQAVITSGTKTGQGRYPLRTRTTVLDAILEAGGTTSDAQLERVQLVRGGRAYALDLQRVLTTGDQANNPELQGGDILIVPGAAQLTKKVVVLGEVKNPDVYLLTEDATLLEAIGRAGGLRESALRDDLRLIRAGSGGPEMLSVNYERITRTGDLEQNLPLRSNDVLYVPRSFLGDLNDVLAKVEPLLNILLLPATFRDLYTTGGGLRIDTGSPPESGSTIYTRPLPGTTGAKPVTEPQTEEQTKKEK